MEVRATQRLGPGQIFNQPQMSRGKPGVQMRIMKLVCDPAKQGSLRSRKEILLFETPRRSKDANVLRKTGRRPRESCESGDREYIQNSNFFSRWWNMRRLQPERNHKGVIGLWLQKPGEDILYFCVIGFPCENAGASLHKQALLY